MRLTEQFQTEMILQIGNRVMRGNGTSVIDNNDLIALPGIIKARERPEAGAEPSGTGIGGNDYGE